jgi:hypothetical protein
VPVTSEGRVDWSLAADGVHDAVHGSAIEPSFPALPVAGDTPIGALMQRVSSLRATLSFDDEPAKMEPAVRSLHTRIELGLGAARE